MRIGKEIRGEINLPSILTIVYTKQYFMVKKTVKRMLLVTGAKMAIKYGPRLWRSYRARKRTQQK